MATTGPLFSSHYLNVMNLESKNKCTVLDGTWILRVIVKFFYGKWVSTWKHEKFTASTNSNTVQKQARWKPVLSVRVKTVVRGVDQMM